MNIYDKLGISKEKIKRKNKNNTNQNGIGVGNKESTIVPKKDSLSLHLIQTEISLHVFCRLVDTLDFYPVNCEHEFFLYFEDFGYHILATFHVFNCKFPVFDV